MLRRRALQQATLWQSARYVSALHKLSALFIPKMSVSCLYTLNGTYPHWQSLMNPGETWARVTCLGRTCLYISRWYPSLAVLFVVSEWHFCRWSLPWHFIGTMYEITQPKFWYINDHGIANHIQWTSCQIGKTMCTRGCPFATLSDPLGMLVQIFWKNMSLNGISLQVGISAGAGFLVPIVGKAATTSYYYVSPDIWSATKKDDRKTSLLHI